MMTTTTTMKMKEEASEFFYPCSTSTPPKLTFDSFASFLTRAERPVMATPPIRRPGAIPFKWEEAPGRPMHTAAGSASAAADADRHLGLPPRLSESAAIEGERRGTKINVSHSIVVGAPYFLIRRPLSFAFGVKERFSFRKGREGKKVRWAVCSEKSSTTTEDTPNSSASSSSFNSFSVGSACSNYSDGGGESEGEEEESEEVVDEGKEEERKVRILRHRRMRTPTCVASHTASQLWVSSFPSSQLFVY